MGAVSGIIGRDFYFRRISKEGHTTLVATRVWDAELFIAARLADCAKEGGKARFSVLTREQYREETGR